MKTLKTYCLSFVSLVLVTTTFSQVRLPKLVSSGMILQRDANIKIWGWAAANENISINFINTDYNVTANSDGKWELQLPLLNAGGPYVMKINASNYIEINDILIGDVWLCSGQSNMAMAMSGVASTYPTDVAVSTNDRIRNFNVPREYEFNTPRTDLTSGEWMKANPTNVLKFSAAAYFFAAALYARNPTVPIGLIHSSYGGTPIHAWMSEKALKAFPETIAEIQLLKNPAYVNNIIQNDITLENNWDANLKNNDAGGVTKGNWTLNSTDTSTWATISVPFAVKRNIGSVWYKKDILVTNATTVSNPSTLQLGTLIDADSTYVNGRLVGFNRGQWTSRKYSVPANTLVVGKNTITVRLVSNSLNGGFTGNVYQLVGKDETIDVKGTWKYKVGYAAAALPAPVNLRLKPTALYNSMIEPLKNYAIKGAIWYQGEGNSGNKPSQYTIYLRSMIEDWRSLFNNPTMPFIYVQLPNYQAAVASPAESNWALLRESQLKTLAVPFTGMATTIDVGDPNNIHPVYKKPVGTRLALAAHRVAYGNDKIVSAGPMYKSMKIVGSTIELTFDTLGSLLKFKSSGGTPVGTHTNFAIAGSNKTFAWAQAKIEGNKVIVWNDAIPNPVAVRYAWGQNPAGEKLYNTEDLPASPFRTDSWIVGKQYFLINYN
ncbi:sialate O-acetylesterase [Flavobacterium sp.]|uniref:sialate O-acetylesterase n=1 Tax=Flavobacterium sp. TaxID=239 RepID=UPI00286E5D2F|nr:sialate O-acetylesterase [Flavobacterium sp.]